MRDIKFRAWDGEKMFPVKEITFTRKGINVRGPGGSKYSSGVCKSPVLMQAIGMKDKHGIDIYENDVVKVDNVGNCRAVYMEDGIKFYFLTLFKSDTSFTVKSEGIEIIGDIYQNPELVKS